jgi:hypothetical protein
MKVRGRRGSGLPAGANVSCRLRCSIEKRGFTVNVVDQWLQSATASALSDSLLDRHSLMIARARAIGLLEEHRAGRSGNHKLLFSLAMFECWLRDEGSPGRRSRCPFCIRPPVGEDVIPVEYTKSASGKIADGAIGHHPGPHGHRHGTCLGLRKSTTRS